MNTPYSKIEPKIKPLVDAMNATGRIRTVASCQGHFGWCAPYVYFLAPVSVAEAIDRALRNLSMQDDSMLKSYWELSARFNEDFKLTFCLSCPDLDKKVWTSIHGFWSFVIRRSRLDAELLALSNVVLAVMSEIGKANELHLKVYSK